MLLSFISIVIYSFYTNASVLRNEIRVSTYDLKLVKYLIQKGIISKTTETPTYVVDPDTFKEQIFYDQIEVKRSNESDNCGGGGVGGLQ